MISILIPVFNEEAILESSITRLRQFANENGVEHEIIVISNGSTDRTNEIGSRLARENQGFKFLTLDRRSVGEAFVRGVKEARFEHIVTVDADLSSDLVFICHASMLLKFCDAVIGSKTLGTQRRTWPRVLASQAYILIAQLFFNLPITDYSMGCKAFKKSQIERALPYIDRWTGYILDLCLFLTKSNRKMVQIGVDCIDNRKSRFNLIHEGIYRYSHLFRTWLKYRKPGSWYEDQGAAAKLK
jgi:glycosyltransferase involved in cell wall biosynthesis